MVAERRSSTRDFFSRKYCWLYENVCRALPPRVGLAAKLDTAIVCMYVCIFKHSRRRTCCYRYVASYAIVCLHVVSVFICKYVYWPKNGVVFVVVAVNVWSIWSNYVWVCMLGITNCVWRFRLHFMMLGIDLDLGTDVNLDICHMYVRMSLLETLVLGCH